MLKTQAQALGSSTQPRWTQAPGSRASISLDIGSGVWESFKFKVHPDFLILQVDNGSEPQRFREI